MYRPASRSVISHLKTIADSSNGINVPSLLKPPNYLNYSAQCFFYDTLSSDFYMLSTLYTFNKHTVSHKLSYRLFFQPSSRLNISCDTSGLHLEE